MLNSNVGELVANSLIGRFGQYAGNDHCADELVRGPANADAKVTAYTRGGNVDDSPDRPLRISRTIPWHLRRRHPAIRGLRFLLCLGVTFVAIVRRDAGMVRVPCRHNDIRELLPIGLARLLSDKGVDTIHDIDTFGTTKGAPNLKRMMPRAGGILVHNRYCFDL
jgi:hypothetical protein